MCIRELHGMSRARRGLGCVHTRLENALARKPEMQRTINREHDTAAAKAAAHAKVPPASGVGSSRFVFISLVAVPGLA